MASDGRRRQRVVLQVKWTPEAKRIIRAMQLATKTLEKLAKKGLPVLVTTGRGRHRRAVTLSKGA